MTEFHKLNSDIEALREVISRDWADLALADLAPEEAASTLQHLQQCNRTLKSLVALRDDSTKAFEQAA